MTAIAFPMSSHPGERPPESSGRIINGFSQALGQGNPSAIAHYRAPGIAPFYTSDETGFRGMTEINGIVYVAFNDRLLKGTAAGGALLPVGTGAFAGTEPVFFARNNAALPDQVVVSENGAHVYTPTSAPASYPDSDLPQPVDVTFGLGFFFFAIANARCYASGLNTTTINPLDFATAEGKPDALKRVVFWSDRLYMLGDGSIEVWGTPINATGFPLSRMTVIPRGIAGARCVCGHENGFDLGLFIVGNDNKVSTLEGYTPIPISTSEVERDIAAVSDKSDIEMSSYYVGGRPCIRIRCPSWTWVYDVQAKQWHERMSHLSVTSRSMATVYAYDKWLCGDTNSGDVGDIREGVYTEWGQPLPWQVESVPPPSFPHPLTIRAARFKFTGGVGNASGIDPIETDPHVMISWTDDGGNHWGYPVARPLGRQALASDVVVNRTGVTGSHGRRWRLVVVDPVHVCLMGGDMDMQLRAPASRAAV